MNRFGILSSSVNPQELAASVQGVIKAVVGFFVLAGLLTTTDAESVVAGTATLVEQIGVLVSAAYAIYGILEVLFGLSRKMVARASRQ